jgi:hypothetical protein
MHSPLAPDGSCNALSSVRLRDCSEKRAYGNKHA